MKWVNLNFNLTPRHTCRCAIDISIFPILFRDKIYHSVFDTVYSGIFKLFYFRHTINDRGFYPFTSISSLFLIHVLTAGGKACTMHSSFASDPVGIPNIFSLTEIDGATANKKRFNQITLQTGVRFKSSSNQSGPYKDQWRHRDKRLERRVSRLTD